MFFDSTYILVLIRAGICALAQWNVNRTFSEYSKVRTEAGITGAQAARRFLSSEALGSMPVNHVAGTLTDHYDPTSKSVSLSDMVYGSTSVAAIGVAAHECGHALQDKEGYMPLAIRSAILPVANIGSKAAWYLILIGLLLTSVAEKVGSIALQAGVVCFMAVVAFQLVTLPVEFNASRRGLELLSREGMLTSEEESQAGKVLFAAALTYVAGAVSSALQLLRLILIANRGRSRR